MSALVDVALTVSINLENTQRQYDAEQQKSVQKRASDRLEQLMTRRKELEENTEEIKNMLTYMFKVRLNIIDYSVFVLLNNRIYGIFALVAIDYHLSKTSYYLVMILIRELV